IAMTPKELGELGELSRAVPVVEPADLPPAEDDAVLDPGQRKSVGHLRRFAQGMPDKPVRIVFDFFAMPVAIEGDGKAERVIIERTALGLDG
ncbi:pyridine nucleotide-disulfide oxidoreductase, partial [Escherichia coli]|nr:pyridine nucleotide-disulfide oxidoreductase [Escherichia coli]